MARRDCNSTPPGSSSNSSFVPGGCHPRLLMFIPSGDACSSRGEAARFQSFLRVNAIVEGHDGVLKFLVGLVAFAGNEHQVARLGLADDLRDGAAAVQFDGAG